MDWRSAGKLTDSTEKSLILTMMIAVTVLIVAMRENLQTQKTKDKAGHPLVQRARSDTVVALPVDIGRAEAKTFSIWGSG
jgi:hypothetical protein